MSDDIALSTPSSTLPPGINAGYWRLSAPVGMRALFTDITGYEERYPQINRQIETASLTIPLILSFGAPFEIGLGHRPTSDDAVPSFLAGLSSAPVFIQSDGRASCLQINFNPLGARRFFNLPMHELTDRMVPLADVTDPELAAFVRRIEDMEHWTERLDHAKTYVTERLGRYSEPAGSTELAFRRLLGSYGRASISSVSKEIGWSRKHLAHQFRRDIGLPPKTVARIIRFDRVLRLTRTCPEINWSAIAIDCGYADQAHLIRDFSEFTGHSPTVWRDLARNGTTPVW
jgi:AraC-like DNA-binding protein